MEHLITAFLPIIILIGGIIITKRTMEVLFVALLAADILICKKEFATGFIDLIYGTLANETFQFILLLIMGLGSLIHVFKSSGVISKLDAIVSRVATTPRKAMLLAWVMAICLFIDEYLNILIVSATIKNTTDALGIPREHLAYTVNSMGACLCVLIPFSSWAAYTTGCMSMVGLDALDYIKSIPFMFFPVITIIISFGCSMGFVPKVGNLKKAYANQIRTNAPLEPAHGNTPGGKGLACANFIIPIIALVLIASIYSNIIAGIFAALFAQFILYVPGHLLSVSKFVTALVDGFSSMMNLMVNIILSFTVISACNSAGLTNYLLLFIKSTIPPFLLPLFTFIFVAGITWLARNYWIFILLLIPIFVPLAISNQLDPHIIIGAIMSGVSFGSLFCFFSDAIFLVEEGTGVSSIQQVKTLFPYVSIAFILSAAAYILPFPI